MASNRDLNSVVLMSCATAVAPMAEEALTVLVLLTPKLLLLLYADKVCVFFLGVPPPTLLPDVLLCLILFPLPRGLLLARLDARSGLLVLLTGAKVAAE